MAHELKAFATKPDHLSWLLQMHIPEGEPICVSCSLDHTHASYPETNVKTSLCLLFQANSVLVMLTS